MQKQYIKNNLFKQSNSLFQKEEKTNPENENKVSKDYDTIRELVLEGKKSAHKPKTDIKITLNSKYCLILKYRLISCFNDLFHNLLT